MRNILPNNSIEIIDFIIKHLPEKEIKIVDMTLGNGKDAFKLLNYFKRSFLYGFDIQEIAIENSEKLLSKSFSPDRFKLINDNHTNILNYIDDDIDLFIYNLGYLPKGDKKIITNAVTTLKSLKDIFKIIKINGLIFMVFYTGHDGGELEYNEVLNFLKEIDQKRFNILRFDFINQNNHPPKLIIIERIR